MASQHAGVPQLEYKTGDIRSLPEYPDGAFGSVLDKGTLDAILCGADAAASAAAALAECCRWAGARRPRGGGGWAGGGA
jgi:hypothetical protein